MGAEPGAGAIMPRGKLGRPLLGRGGGAVDGVGSEIGATGRGVRVPVSGYLPIEASVRTLTHTDISWSVSAANTYVSRDWWVILNACGCLVSLASSTA